MTGRPPRDLRAEAADRLTRLLHREQHPTPEALALELLVALGGIHIGLTDTSRSANPDADALHPPTPAAPDSPARDEFRRQREAMKGTQQ